MKVKLSPSLKKPKLRQPQKFKLSIVPLMAEVWISTASGLLEWQEMQSFPETNDCFTLIESSELIKAGNMFPSNFKTIGRAIA